MLSVRDKKFVEYYHLCDNQAEAARKAGFAPSTALKKASLWIGETRLTSKKPEMWDYLKELGRKALDEYEVTRGEVLRGMHRIAKSDISDMFDDFGDLKDIADMSEDTRMAIAGIEVNETKIGDGIFTKVKKIKLNDRLGAWSNISRMLGYNAPEEHKHSGEIKTSPLDLSNVPLEVLKELAKHTNDTKTAK